jgi:heat shock protein HtpX
MARTRYAPDRGLTVRMTVTMFLLGLVFVAFVAAIIGILTAVHASGAAIVLFALIFGGGSAIASLFYSDKIALSAAGARVVTPKEAPELHAIVDRLCALADMDKPRVAIAPTAMPNAFATGRNSKNSVLCVTDGLLRSGLDTEELEGVLAHELSHVAHKDVQVMTVASLLAIVAGLLVRFAFYSELFGGGRRSSNNNQGGIPVVLIIMAVSVVVYAVSFLLIRVLSRYRELAADRSGALLTGQPSKLASALTKVSQGMSRIPNEDLRAAEPLNAFYFAPAMKLTRGGGGGGGGGRNGGGGPSLSQLFSTHPSLEKRLEQLAKIQRELGQPTAGGLSAGPGD